MNYKSKFKNIYIKLVFVFIISCNFFESSYAIRNKGYFVVNDSVPMFPGGDSSLAMYIGNKININRMYETGFVGGMFQATFTVTNEGKINNLQILYKKSFNPDIISQLEKTLLQMPNWIPGIKQSGDFDYHLIFRIFLSKDQNSKIVVYPWDAYLGLQRKEQNDKKFNVFFSDGIKKSNDSDWEAAFFNFNEAVKLRPNDVLALYNRGIARFNLKDRDGACDDWNKVKSFKSSEANEVIKKYCKDYK